MGQPLKPKALKPKAANEGAGGEAPAPKPSGGGGGKGGFDLPFIILIVCMMLFSIGGSALTLFLLGPMVLVPAITEQIQVAGGGAKGVMVLMEKVATVKVAMARPTRLGMERKAWA